jgi:hypothetical protein
VLGGNSRSTQSETAPATGEAVDSAELLAPFADPLANHSSPGADTSTRLPAASGSGRLDAASWATIFGGLFEQTARLLHSLLATSPADQAGDVWRTEVGEPEKFGEPVGNIAARRAQLPGGADMADALKAGAVLLAYGIRNGSKALSNRRAARRRPIGPDLVEHPTS